MKIVTLCREGTCCPVVKLADDHVEIGEEGNLCVLTTSEWETLKNKILNDEIQASTLTGVRSPLVKGWGLCGSSALPVFMLE